jgi:membrane protein DedA with SNARE-associated domain
LANLLTAFGYWAVVVLVALEGFGIPLPGETMLITAAVYAGATHQMSLPLIIAAAFAGAVVGSTGGYAIGYWGGFRLLIRFGKYIRLHEPRVKLGRYLFLRYGGKVVFFGRFISILRTYAAFLAGTARMPPWRFFVFNVAGAIAWASGWALVAYRLGEQINRFSRTADIALGVAAVAAVVGVYLFWRRNEHRLIHEAEQALPGPLDA